MTSRNKFSLRFTWKSAMLGDKCGAIEVMHLRHSHVNLTTVATAHAEWQ